MFFVNINCFAKLVFLPYFTVLLWIINGAASEGGGGIFIFVPQIQKTKYQIKIIFAEKERDRRSVFEEMWRGREKETDKINCWKLRKWARDGGRKDNKVVSEWRYKRDRLRETDKWKTLLEN